MRPLVAVMLATFVVCMGCGEAHVAPSPDASCPSDREIGEPCTPDNPCRVGEWACSADGWICTPQDPLPEGAPCDVGVACDHAGNCSVCTPGVSCDSGIDGPCIVAEIDCSSGEPVCVFIREIPPGECLVECDESWACDVGNPCVRGRTDCSTGEPVCVASEPYPEGTTCGFGLACDARGECTMCQAGGTCDSGSPCVIGEYDCTTGLAQCLAVADEPEGTPCGVTGFCDGSGGCSECIPGTSCEQNEGCFVGTLDCETGTAVCTFVGNRPVGTPCGGDGTCDADGACIR